MIIILSLSSLKYLGGEGVLRVQAVARCVYFSEESVLGDIFCGVDAGGGKEGSGFRNEEVFWVMSITSGRGLIGGVGRLYFLGV